MASIEWQQRFATGIDCIDSQHKQLIELINRLEMAVEQHQRDGVEELLVDIDAYVASHFSHEEQLLEQSGFKFIESHIRGHRRFVERLDNLRRRFESGAYVSRELLSFLQRWLISHIAHEDQQYVADVKRILELAETE